METKPLLYGLIGFIVGGLLVATAATTFNKPKPESSTSSMSMSSMTADLQGKNGDDFDEAFINNMITHHEGAVDMAKLAADSARHDEIKKLSKEIISAQEKEITEMKHWQSDWGYKTDGIEHMPH